MCMQFIALSAFQPAFLIDDQSLQEGCCYQTLTSLVRNCTSHRILSYPGIPPGPSIPELTFVSEERFAPENRNCRYSQSSTSRFRRLADDEQHGGIYALG
jgi:hypothetical protein